MLLAGKILKWWWLAALVSLGGAIVLPCVGMGGPNFIDLKINKVFMDLAGINAGLEQFRQRRGDYPTDAEGLEAMTGVSMIRVSKDAWGSSYVYKRNAPGRPLVYSAGIDQVDSGGAGDDVSSRDKHYRCEDYALNCGPTASDIAAYGALLLLPLSLITGLIRGIMWLIRRARPSPAR